MRMRALDSFYSSETRQAHKGMEFTVSDARGAEFAKRGLAEEVQGEDLPAEDDERPDDSEDGEQVDAQGLDPIAPVAAGRRKKVVG